MLKPNDGNTYASYTWPGGYPLEYLATAYDNPYDRREFIICSTCANKALANHIAFVLTQDEWFEPECDVTAGEVYWEGSTMQCEVCNGEIESAYGDPEETD